MAALWFAISLGEHISTVKLRNIEYILEEALTGIWRNGLMAFASITTVALSLGVLGVFVLASLGAKNFAAAQVGKFEIAVFMVDSAGQHQANDLVGKIKQLKGVSSIELRDRNAEWGAFKREHPDIESAGLPLNVLPYAMNTKISDPERTAVIANKIRTMDGVDKVIEGRDTLNRVMAVAHVIKMISAAGVLILLITAVFIISNAIKLTLYARRREIRIMQLVGATNWFIRVPLVIEGVVFGALGALVAWGLLGLGSIPLANSVHKISPLIGTFNSGVGPAHLAIWLTILGATIGAAGSFVSIRRFLRD